jgi:hypothetical protein
MHILIHGVFIRNRALKFLTNKEKEFFSLNLLASSSLEGQVRRITLMYN